MTGYPNKLIMILSILLVVILANYRYSSKLNKQLLQFKFDWNKEKIIHEIDDLKIDSLSYNRLMIDDVKENYKPNNQNTYSVVFDDNSKFYFRYVYSNITDSKILFSGLEWLNGQPEEKNQSIKLIESNIPMKKTGGKIVMTIGNEIVFNNEAKYFRRKMAEERKIDFIGDDKDVFNYSYQNINDSEQIMNQVKDIEPAEVYIIFWSPNEHTQISKTLQEDFQNLINFLDQTPKTQKIIWITLPSIKDNEQNFRIHLINEMIENLKSSKLIRIDSESILNEKNQEYLMSDGLSLNKYGYEKLAQGVIKQIK